MSTPDVERRLAAVLQSHAEEAMNRTDTRSRLEVLETGIEASTRQRRLGAAAAAAAAVAVAGALAWAYVQANEDRSAPGPATNEEVARVTDVFDGGVLPPGRYQVEFEGAPPGSSEAEVDVPRGYRIYNGSVLWNDADKSGSGGLMFWTVDKVARDPCAAVTATGKSFYDPGPGVRDLATALRQQRYRQGPPPQPVTFAGHDGLYLELTFTDELPPVDSCLGRDLDAWEAGGTARFQYAADSVDRIWILDVDGQRLVVNQTYDASTAREGEPKLDRMLESVRIGDRSAE